MSEYTTETSRSTQQGRGRIPDSGNSTLTLADISGQKKPGTNECTLRKSLERNSKPDKTDLGDLEITCRNTWEPSKAGDVPCPETNVHPEANSIWLYT